MYLFKHEFINLIEELGISMEDRSPIIRMAGYNDNKIKLPIKNLIDRFYKREERKYSKMNEILFSLALILHNNLIEIEKIYSFLKINDTGELSFIELKQGLNSLDIIISDNDLDNLFRCLDINSNNKIKLDSFIENLRVRKIILDDIDNLDEKIRHFNKNKVKYYYKFKIFDDEDNNNISKKNDISLKSDENNKIFEKNLDKKKVVCEKELVMSSNNNEFCPDDRKDKENENDNNLERNDENLNEIENEKFEENHQISRENSLNKSESLEKIKLDNVENNINISINDNKSIKSEKVSSEIDEDFLNSEDKDKLKPTNINSSLKNEIKSKSIKKESMMEKVIDGELKVQIKNAKNLILPKTLKKPFKFYLSLSLEGANENKALDSRVVEHTDGLMVVFNWAARVPLLKRILKEIGVYLKVELYISSSEGNLPFNKLGESMINWTTAIQKQNISKWIINENSPISSKLRVIPSKEQKELWIH